MMVGPDPIQLVHREEEAVTLSEHQVVSRELKSCLIAQQGSPGISGLQTL